MNEEHGSADGPRAVATPFGAIDHLRLRAHCNGDARLVSAAATIGPSASRHGAGEGEEIRHERNPRGGKVRRGCTRLSVRRHKLGQKDTLCQEAPRRIIFGTTTRLTASTTGKHANQGKDCGRLARQCITCNDSEA